MDTSSWRSTQGLGEAVGGYSIKCGDWRTQLQEHARQRIVNKIMYTLKSNPFFGHEGLHKLKNRAVGFEEKVYTAATSQTDYLQKISSMVLNLEPRLQNPMPDAMQSNSGAKTVNPSHPDSTAQTGNANSVSGGQQQLLGIQSGNSGMQTNQHSVHMVQSNIPLQQQNQQSSGNFPTQVQQSQPQLQQQVMPHMHSQSGQLQQQQQVGVQQQPNLLQRDMQQRLSTLAGFQQQNVFDQQKQLSQQQRSMPEASSNPTSQSDNANDGHQQEEVYQKIKAMKDLYLLELNELNNKFFGKLQQSGAGTVCDSSMDTGDWRAQLEAGSRQGLVNMITDTLKKHLPFTRHGDLQQIKNMAVRHEDIIYTAAASQFDYLRELFTMMMIMETPMRLKADANGVNPTDPGGKGVVGDCSMVYDDWRAQMQADSRKRIVNIIMDTLKSHHLSSRDEELKQKSMRFEEKTYDAATSQSEYLHNISLMMLALQIRSQNPMGADSINTSDPGGSGVIGDSSMESGDWRSQLQADSRQKMVNKIMETFKRHLPFSGHEGLHEHNKKIAMGFEENIYTAAASLSDYLRKISIKLLVMKARSRNYGANSVNPSDPDSQVMQEVNKQGQPLPIPVPSNHPQQGQ